MCFKEYVKSNREDFLIKTQKIACELGIDANWLMFVMYFESRLNPKAENPYSGATGLIQFMPNTARSLGTTVEELAEMTNLQQLDYVFAYLKPHKGKMHSWVDVYLAVFYPAAMRKPDTWAITRPIVAKQNPVFDINKDGKITIAEIKTALRNNIPAKYKDAYPL